VERVKTVFKGALLHVITKQVRLPNGYRVRLELIRHPGAALIVPFIAKGRMLLLRQLRPVIGSYLYELPAGTLHRGESPLACARREIVEETGYSAARLVRLGTLHPVPGYSTETITVYKAEGLKRKGRAEEKDEIIESRVVTRGEVRRLFKSGRLTDAKTISALAMCGWL
jgi:ADP-ribose pyrophosphatase